MLLEIKYKSKNKYYSTKKPYLASTGGYEINKYKGGLLKFDFADSVGYVEI